MAQILPMSDPGNYRRVHERIKKLWAEGKTEIGHHAQERMKERKIDITDVQNVIRYGRIAGHSKPMTLWRYTIVGKAVDGENTKCIVEIDGTLIIVTVI
jgi:hypothetical protein